MRRTALAAIAIGVGVAAGGWGWPAEGEEAPRRPDWRAFVFHAVLEGCYADGVAAADVAHVLRLDAATDKPMHFVDRCPLCMPALDAFRLYERRPRLESWTDAASDDTFGDGLGDWVRGRLRSDEFKDRLDAVNWLVHRWIARRVEQLRPSDDERRVWQRDLKMLMKKGTLMLRAAKEAGTAGTYGALEGCAVCQACASGADSKAGK